MQRLAGVLRTYAWGSRTALPALLGAEPDGRPQAEYWLGAHPTGPAVLAGGGRLDEHVRAAPERVLSPAERERFGSSLPFLLKLLAAQEPLSLQVHPSAERARAGFAAEEARGVPLDAPHRSYKDPHHKPEMVLALTEFDALCSFRPVERTRALLRALDAPLLADVERCLGSGPDDAARLRAATVAGLRTPREVVAAGSGELAARAAALPPELALEGQALQRLVATHPDDPGLLVAVLLNVVRLQPGQALALPAGEVHAYLAGTAVEVMASSDNVLRGGLTPKHVDEEELLAVVRFVASEPPFVQPTGGRYAPDVEEFRLEVATPSAPVRAAGGARVVLAVEGEAQVRPLAGGSAPLRLEQGGAALVEHADGAVELCTQGRAVLAASGRS